VHPDLPDEGISELISRQVRAFTSRSEPAEWKVYAHGAPADLAHRLSAAGLIPGWTRQVLIAATDSVTVEDAVPRGTPIDEHHAELPELVTGTGPHRAPLAELLADGLSSYWELHTAGLAADGRLLAAGWVEMVRDTEFAAIGGMTEPDPAILADLCAWARRPRAWTPHGGAAYILAEADGALAALLTRAGFQTITSATSYHLTPQTPPARERPVVEVCDQEDKPLWDRFYTDFQFRPGVKSMPAIAEPEASVTWHLDKLHGDKGIDDLQRIVERGLRACVEPGESLYWLDWQHVGYRWDPARVGGPGQADWPGGAYPDGDYYIYLTPDLRLGTFGHPWEHSLCVFGADLLAEIETDLTTLLGTPMRRSGRAVGNMGSFCS
jgi:hypothetical protein